MTDCGSSHSHSHGQQHLHRTDLSLDKKEELSDILQIVLTGYKNTIPAISVLSKLLLLTLAIAIIQMSVGLWSNNLLLLCHSAHSTFDSFQLLVAVLSSVVKLSKRSQSATQSFSYGLQRLPILGAFSNATLGILGKV
jgi:Co/Zn/Cd efflux system component|tara:strand:+ start:27 stop:440 length:414 start_codon:yes stop_codon:yes gene_type:complete